MQNSQRLFFGLNDGQARVNTGNRVTVQAEFFDTRRNRFGNQRG